MLVGVNFSHSRGNDRRLCLASGKKAQLVLFLLSLQRLIGPNAVSSPWQRLSRW